MSTKNAILGICAASLAIGSAVASVLAPTNYKVRRADGLETIPFTAEQTIVCPSGTAKSCKVKLVSSAGTTIPGYTSVTVLTTNGAVVQTAGNTATHVITIAD